MTPEPALAAKQKRVDLTVAAEQQPCGVQVVERVGLVVSGFQVVKWFGLVFLLQ